jgi:hypothetical protein
MAQRTPPLQVRVRHGHQLTVIPCNRGIYIFEIRLKLNGHNK